MLPVLEMIIANNKSLLSYINWKPQYNNLAKIVKSCFIKKNIGILDDRVFALSKNISFEKAKIIEQNPKERKLSYFLTLKNTPILNKYNFEYINDELNLILEHERIFSVKLNDKDISSLITNKLFELEKSLKGPFFLLKNKDKFNSIILRYFNVAGADINLRTGLISNDATHLIKIISEI